MELIKNLNWRYATKKFDTTKKVQTEELQKLKEAVRLSASSYGLQAYKVLIVENPEIRKQLRKAAWDQPQITDSSQLVIFCNYTKVDEGVIDEYLQLVSETKGIQLDLLAGFKQMLMGSTATRSEAEISTWTAKQTYIALSTLLSAASELKIDACPMEGFDPNAFNEILGLKEKGLSAAVIAAVGYRSTEDESQFSPKVRKSELDLFETI